MTYISRKNKFYINTYKKGDVLWVDLGMNIGSELSYEHPCIVLENRRGEVFIVPCSSSRISKTNNKKTGKIYEEYIIGEISDGFQKRTVLLLNNSKWVSKSRVLKNLNVTLDKTFITKVYDTTFTYLFKDKAYLINIFSKKMKEKEIELEEKDIEVKRLNEKIIELELQCEV